MSPAVHEKDQDLLGALSEGDPQAIVTLYQRHGARMVGFAARYVDDRSAAEDVVVSLLGRWLERPPRIGSADRLNAFLATSVYHAAVDWLRRDRAQRGQAPRSVSPDRDEDRRLAGPLSDVQAGDPPETLRRRLQSALEQMSPNERLLLESHYGHAVTAEECMENLAISRAAFHQRLHRARLHLAQLLAQQEDER